MIAKKIKSAFVDRSDAVNYMKRAKELLQSMRTNLAVENWNAAVVDGVHATIGANDAVTIISSGKRSTSNHHLDAVELLEQSIPKDLQTEMRRLQRVISIKSHVEYGPSLVREKEAFKVAEDVERFVAWAEKVFDKLKT